MSGIQEQVAGAVCKPPPLVLLHASGAFWLCRKKQGLPAPRAGSRIEARKSIVQTVGAR